MKIFKAVIGPIKAAAVLVIPILPSEINAAEVRYTDVTAEAGIHYIQHTLPADLYYPVHMSGGVAVGDYDGDGYLDLFDTRLAAANILYRNMCDGTFQDVTANTGLDKIIADSNGAGWADLDHDGDLDLYVTALWSERFYLFINDGNGQFSEQALRRGVAIEGQDSHFGYGPAFADFDRDGFIDIHVTEWRHDEVNPSGASSNARLLRNRGQLGPGWAGFFEDVTDAAGVSLDNIPSISINAQAGSFSFASQFSDIDNDGWLELLIASEFGQSRLFWNNGDGTFTDGTVAAGVGTDENGMGHAVADFDGDGLLDWFVTSISGEQRVNHTGNRLFKNLGNRKFADVTDQSGVRDGFWGWAAVAIDYDNDGDLDLTMSNGVIFPDDSDGVGFDDDMTRFWKNDGAGNFTELSSAIGIEDGKAGKGLVKLDYDNDGDLDLFVVNNRDAPILYRNDGGNNNGWLRIVVSGTGIGAGARFTLETGNGMPLQVRELEAGNAFLGQHEQAVHFGLGPNPENIKRLTIRWPNGEIQELLDIEPNQTIPMLRGNLAVSSSLAGQNNSSCTFPPLPKPAAL